MKRIVTFGEIMLRLSPEGYYRFVQAEKYLATYGGAEANVAVSLSNYGLNAAYITKLPDNDVAQKAINYMRSYGVDTSMITRGGRRIGVYFLEKGASERASKVVYDRAGSAIAEAETVDFDWNKIFENCSVFFFTGITPALSDNTVKILKEACETAKKKGVKIVCDLNYRATLWNDEKAGKTMREFMKYVDLLVANENHIRKLFGIKADGAYDDSTLFEHDRYEQIAVKVEKEFGIKELAVTIRKSYSAGRNDFAAVYSVGGKRYYSARHSIEIVDRVGSGDSFSAGLIYSLTVGKNPQEAVDFAAAACALCHTVEGDANLVSVKEVETLAAGNSGGSVVR